MTLAMRPDLTTNMFENFRISLRSDAPIVVMSFFQWPTSDTPARFEVFRGVTTVDHARRMMDAMAKIIQYYPVPEKGAKVP